MKNEGKGLKWRKWRRIAGIVVLLSLLGDMACAANVGEQDAHGNSQSTAGTSIYEQESERESARPGLVYGGESGSKPMSDGTESGDGETEQESGMSSGESSVEPGKPQLIFPEGNTLAERIAAPDGYERISVDEGSLARFLRDYPMKQDGAPVLLYNGREKGNQTAHVAVFQLPIEAEDLQQCADSVMRVYAEYYWMAGQYDKICFHFSDGFAAEYAKWREGYRIQVNGNRVSWTKSKAYDNSYETFQKYMRIVFAYAGTASMENEATGIEFSKLQVGDVFLKGGSPGHVVLVTDLCENAEGKKAFLLAQGYMPAQEFHVLKNPEHGDDPWYYEDEFRYPFVTPEYVFPEGSLKSLNY